MPIDDIMKKLKEESDSPIDKELQDLLDEIKRAEESKDEMERKLEALKHKLEKIAKKKEEIQILHVHKLVKSKTKTS